MKTNHNYSVIKTVKTAFENLPQFAHPVRIKGVDVYRTREVGSIGRRFENLRYSRVESLRHGRSRMLGHACAAVDSTRTSSLGWPLRNWRTVVLFWLCVLLISTSKLSAQTVLTGTGLKPYVMHNPDPTKVDKEPPKGGGNGWDPVGPDGITLQPHEIVALAVRNVYNSDRTKTCKVMLGKKGDGRGKSLKDNIGKSSPMGWDQDGAPIQGIIRNEPYFPRDTVIIEFDPQPAWERINLENKTDAPITFPVEVETKCVKHKIRSRTYTSNCSFGAADAMVEDQFTTEILMFPQTVQLDPSAPPTFSAPPDSGNWTAIPVYDDPDGTNHPLGGVLYTTDGPGLSPGEECEFSFTMQGPAADLQYTMYAYDSVSGEYQDYQIDLRPTLAISTSNNTANLQFDSTLGLNYILESSTDLHTWQPRQTIIGTGETINSSTSATGPVGFFRLRCIPSPIADHTPPTLSTIAAAAFRNTLVLSFSEPMNSITASNRLNYFVGNNLGPIQIQNVSLVGARAVKLTLATTLTPASNYFLGISGVTDLNGNAITPTTLPFTAATLQTPCAGGTLLVKQAYSECNPDGFWHVVEDDWYRCPDGSTQKFRVADTKTTQPCAAGQTAPSSSAGLLYPTAADVASACQSPLYIGQVQVCECFAGLWSISTYLQYRCLDGTIYLSGPVQNVPINPPATCDQPAPPMPAP